MKIVLIIFFIPLQLLAQTYDIYSPKNKAKIALVFVHGGAWVSGDKAEYKDLGQKLKSQKICAVMINYRLAPEYPHPAQIGDLDIVLTKLQSEKIQTCNFKKIILVGHSAGAHMIAMWAHRYERSFVKGFVGLEGIYDLPALAKKWPTYSDWFLKKEFGSEEKWAEASPAQVQLISKTPWLIVHSEDDELVDIKQSEIFAESLKKQNIKFDFLKTKGDSHFTVLNRLGEPSGPLIKKLNQLFSK